MRKGLSKATLFNISDQIIRHISNFENDGRCEPMNLLVASSICRIEKQTRVSKAKNMVVFDIYVKDYLRIDSPITHTFEIVKITSARGKE